MENERNNILEDFRYGFCDLSGEFSNSIKELESQLGWNDEAISLLTEIYPIVGKINLDLAEDRKSIITIDEYDFKNDELLKNPRNNKWQEKYEKYDFRSDNRWREVRPIEALVAISDYNDIIVGLRNLLYSEIELTKYTILDKEYDKETDNILFEFGLQLTNFFGESVKNIFDGYHYFRSRIYTNSPRVRYLVYRIIINWLYLRLILCQPSLLLPDLFHRACMSNGKLPAPC